MQAILLSEVGDHWAYGILARGVCHPLRLSLFFSSTVNYRGKTPTALRVRGKGVLCLGLGGRGANDIFYFL